GEAGVWKRKKARRAGEAGTADRADCRIHASGPMSPIEYRDGFDAADFVALANRVWPRDSDEARAAAAIMRTINIGAWDGARLVGAVRVLSDGYLFSTVPEILVEPQYQRRGIGRELMRRALDRAPRGALFFGAQSQSVRFFERSEEHTSELQSLTNLVCRLLLEKKKKKISDFDQFLRVLI